MPGLDSPQFEGYAFRTTKDRFGTQAAVAKVHPPGDASYTGMLHETRHEPLGSMSIYTDREQNNENQKDINNRHRTFDQHDVSRDEGGQMRWSRGNFESDNPHVGWAAMAKVPGHSRLLSGVAALVVHEHGSMPNADSALSDSGARLARGAARKYGMKPAAGNPKMESGFSSFGEGQARREAGYVWEGQNTKQYSAAETANVVKSMDEKYRVRSPKALEQTHIHPGQLKML